MPCVGFISMPCPFLSLRESTFRGGKMPIYEYRCQTCDQNVEVLQKVGSPPPEACGECGSTGTMSKLVSQTCFQLKGDGWFKDLYSSSPSPAKNESSPSSEPPKNAESTDSKEKSSDAKEKKSVEPQKTPSEKT